nr:hypothetical protein [Tanacetum cinerariifolium]
NTTVVKRTGDVTRLQALVDKKRIVITEEVVREILQLNDAEGVICVPNDEIFAGLARMGYEKPSTKLTFYKAFFSTQWKFFIHTILHFLKVDQEKSAEVEGRHADTQAEIYNIDLDHSSKVAAASTPISAAKPKVLKIAAAPAVSTRRRKGVVIRDPEKELHTDTPAETPTMKDKGKGILIEDPKPMKKKDQVEMDAEYAKKLQEELNKDINETPAQKAAKRRKLSEEAQEDDDLKKRLEIVQDEDDDVFVKAIPLA